MPIVKFTNEKKEIEVPQGAWLRTEAVKAGINLNCGINGIGETLNKYANCHGFGMCGTCRVLITKGTENTNPMTMREKMKFKFPFPDPIPCCLMYLGNEGKMRLACMTQVLGDMEVESSPKVNLFGENFFS